MPSVPGQKFAIYCAGPRRRWLRWASSSVPGQKFGVFAALLLALVATAATDTALAAGPPGGPTAAELAAYDEAARTILCDCGCHPQSVHDCACGRAAEMRDEVRGLAAQGLDGEAIIARYVAEHGEKIRIAPTATGFNLVAWLGPFVLILAAASVVFFALRRWRVACSAAEHAEAPRPPALSADDPYVQRLRREVEES